MGFTWQLGEYNTEGTFNKFVVDNLNTSLPAWRATAFPINFEYPDTPLLFPSFSVTHLGTLEAQTVQGSNVGNAGKGQEVRHIAEISAWVTETDNDSWRRDLSQMRDMVIKLFSNTRQIPVYDLYASTSSPALIQSRLRVTGAQEIEVPEDPNPAVHRRRILVTYDYWQRQ